MERYSTLYAPYSNTAGSHPFKDCAYTAGYNSPHPHFDSGQFRPACEERFPVREGGDFLHLHCSPGDEPKLDETIQLTPLSRELRTTGVCSRSSSRGEGFFPSNRSDSPTSEVDVTSEDIDVNKLENNQCSKLVKSHVNVPSESVPQSVIMRMPNANQTFPPSPRYSCDFNKSSVSKSPRSAHAEVVKYPSEHESSHGLNFFVDDTTDKLYDGIKQITCNSKTIQDDPIMQCLRTGTYSYDPYPGGPMYPGQGLPAKPYGMPQAGYTSVIVDAQQYQMANGFVH